MQTLQFSLLTDELSPSQVGCIGGCSTTLCTFSCDILISKRYKLEVKRPLTPNDNNGGGVSAIQPFQLSVSSQPTLSSVPSIRTELVKAT